MSPTTDRSRLRCLLFSDLVGSTALETQIGDGVAGDLIERRAAMSRVDAGHRLAAELGKATIESL